MARIILALGSQQTRQHKSSLEQLQRESTAHLCKPIYFSDINPSQPNTEKDLELVCFLQVTSR